MAKSNCYFDRFQQSTLVCGVPSGSCKRTVSIICFPFSGSENTLVFVGCPCQPPAITKIRGLGIVIDTESQSALPISGNGVPSGVKVVSPCLVDPSPSTMFTVILNLPLPTSASVIVTLLGGFGIFNFDTSIVHVPRRRLR